MINGHDWGKGKEGERGTRLRRGKQENRTGQETNAQRRVGAKILSSLGKT